MASTNTPPNPCYLFTIPIELRLQIYELTLASFNLYPDSKPTPDPTELPHKFHTADFYSSAREIRHQGGTPTNPLPATPHTAYLHPLLNTSAQIRSEAAQPYHHRLHEIMDHALKGARDAREALAEWRRAVSSVLDLLETARLYAEEKKAVEWYRRMTLVVRGEIVLAKAEMEGKGAAEKREVGERDLFGDWYGVSAVRETYGRGE